MDCEVDSGNESRPDGDGMDGEWAVLAMHVSIRIQQNAPEVWQDFCFADTIQRRFRCLIQLVQTRKSRFDVFLNDSQDISLTRKTASFYVCCHKNNGCRQRRRLREGDS
jgi:hypothetical protein